MPPVCLRVVGRLMPRKKVAISNKLGLHARPAMTFAECAKQFESDIKVRRNDAKELVDGKSIMQLLMLAGTCGTKLEISAEGPDAKEALKELTQLVKGGFDEE